MNRRVQYLRLYLRRIKLLFMIRKFIYFIAISFIVSCQSGTAPTESGVETLSADVRFEHFKESFIDELWKVYPGWATLSGYHKYDSILVVPNDAFRSQEIDFTNSFLDSLSKFNIAELSESNQTDLRMIDNLLRGNLFYSNEFKEFEKNPSAYNVGNVFAEILQYTKVSLDERMQVLYSRMRNVPQYYEAALSNIKNPTLEHTELAIAQNSGTVDAVFLSMMKDSLKKSGLSEEERKIFTNRLDSSVNAIKSYIDTLKSWVSQKDRQWSSFRVGKDLYEKKFTFEIQSGFTAGQIYQKALDRKREVQQEMLKITKEIFHKYFPHVRVPGELNLEHTKMLIDEISKKHVHRDSFQTAIERQIPELTRFVEEKNLIYLDPEKPLVVRKEPAYMAGVAGASINSPGPYDKDGNTYYNVGSLANYSSEGAESYLREYNHYILQILNIHEAVPGHYAQLVYSNKAVSLVKSLFGNGAMIEGWAVYTERMMLEAGYGNNEPEMWLMYYKWHLRSVCNTILDYSVHVLDMSREDALNLLVNEAFQQKQEAENKWKRVTLTSVQLTSYFTGYTEIYEFREELKKKQGDAFKLKEFHEKFLSYGSAPVKYIKELMLK